MNLCVLKHSHKAQILEHDESLAEGSYFFSSACTRCPDGGCGLCEDPAMLLAGRASLQGSRMAVPSVLTTGRPSCLWQVTVPAVLGQFQGCVMLFLSCPSQSLPRICQFRALLMCPRAVCTARVAHLAMTSNTLSLSVQDHVDTKGYLPL